MCILQILYTEGKVSKYEIDIDEPESVDYPAQPVHFSYFEYYLPSNSALIRFITFSALGLGAVTFYVFLLSWKGALFWRWFKWSYDIDDITFNQMMKKLSVPSKIKIPKFSFRTKP